MRCLLRFVLQDYVPSVFMPSFMLPVCIFETHVKFAYMRLYQHGVTFEDLVSADFAQRFHVKLRDVQLMNAVKAYIIVHAMYWSVLPSTAECKLYCHPINPVAKSLCE
jgi:hypothetical protein